MLPKRPKMNHRTKDKMMEAEINGKRARLRSNMLSIQKPFGPSYRLENERDKGVELMLPEIRVSNSTS